MEEKLDMTHMCLSRFIYVDRDIKSTYLIWLKNAGKIN